MGELLQLRPDRWVTRDELASFLGVSTRTVDRWVVDGCPSETFGLRLRRFRLQDVEVWLQRRSARSA